MPSTPLIETERLRLRAVTADDLDELVRLHQDPLVTRFMGSPDRGWLTRWLRSSDEEWEERGHRRLAIVEKESGRFLGRTGLKYWSQFEETEIGWAFHAEARGQGYAVAERLGMSPLRPDKLLGDPVTVWATERR